MEKEEVGREPGQWTCRYCGIEGIDAYGNLINKHYVACSAPSGRCAKCGEPRDEHKDAGSDKPTCRISV